MSDVEQEEVKVHPCDKYQIPDCPGKNLEKNKIN